jgi:glutamate N-acetyltransferase/amino-acid N-acetyltransferase
MGDEGHRSAAEMAQRAAEAVGCEADQFYVASTGVIGEPLPMPKVRRGIRAAEAALVPEGLALAAEAIRTTDTYAKTAHTTVRMDGKTVHVAGIAKGSGMIQPNMATMLAFILTDAAVAPRHLQRTLKRVSDSTFNRVTVDGETSTSDTLLLLANGVAGNTRLASSRGEGAAVFEDAVHRVSETLARGRARDGEGATKLITVDVKGARSPGEAETAARRVANSVLVKTAIFGRDPNWGRILQSVGAGRVKIRLERAEVKLGGVSVFKRGASTGPAARQRAAKRLSADEVTIEVQLGAGRSTARVWSCDLSYDYVKINAEYTT